MKKDVWFLLTINKSGTLHRIRLKLTVDGCTKGFSTSRLRDCHASIHGLGTPLISQPMQRIKRKDEDST